MQIDYLNHVVPGELFYREPDGDEGEGQSVRYELPRLDWSGWCFDTTRTWSSATPADSRLPRQGWKIHCTATPRNARRILSIVAEQCHRWAVPFKFVPDDRALVAKNAKLAPRTSSGKFITIYPRDERELLALLERVSTDLAGLEGPAILGDLRWRDDSPVFLRYGGFQPRFIGAGASGLAAIENPEGALVPDVRGPTFRPPAWVVTPGPIAERATAEKRAAPGELDAYDISGAIRFTNAGGLYRARRRTSGEEVVLKEARPLAGVDADGCCAVDRLCREEATLTRLTGKPGIVSVERCFTAGGHRFLSLHRAPGVSLTHHLFPRNPLLSAASPEGAFLDYRDETLDLIASIADVLTNVHEAGIVHGDLHPDNIIVETPRAASGAPTAPARVTLLDFESSHDIDDPRPPARHGVPGYAAPPEVSGVDADHFALAALCLNAFLPLTFIHHLDSEKSRQHIAFAREVFDLPAQVVDRLTKALRPTMPRSTSKTGTSIPASGQRAHAVVDTDQPSESNDSATETPAEALLVKSLLASAEQGNPARHYPGDIAQYGAGRIGLAHGVSGVLRALGTSGEETRVARAWLTDQLDDPGLATGLFDGVAGALILSIEQGLSLTADLEDRVLATDLDHDCSLRSGASGRGVALLSLPDRRITQRVKSCLREIVEAVHDCPIGSEWAGLLDGTSGHAVFLARFARRFGDREAWRSAERLVSEDLLRCQTLPDGSLQVDDGGRMVPYIDGGSAGIGLAALEVLAGGHSQRLVQAVRGIELAAWTPFTINAGLFEGRAGLMQFLAELSLAGRARPETPSHLARHARDLRLHAIRHADGLAFPGRQFLRLSSDWATGTAGVLTALQASRHALRSPARSLPTRFLPAFAMPRR